MRAREAMKFSTCLPAMVLLLLMAGCSAAGDSANPLARNLGWFAFLDGDDLRQGCAPGAPDRYRFVYNGRWREQVRIYEIAKTPAGDRGDLKARVIFPETLSLFSTDDLLAPWRGKVAAVPLTQADLATIDEALAASGFDEPTPDGLVLHSDGSYWVAIACRGGQFHYNAYAYPSPRFAALRFPAELLKYDATGVAVLPPREGLVDRYEYGSRMEKRGGAPVAFDLQVGRNGLKLPGPFL
jgi:hypothetical protein